MEMPDTRRRIGLVLVSLVLLGAQVAPTRFDGETGFQADAVFQVQP